MIGILKPYTFLWNIYDKISKNGLKLWKKQKYKAQSNYIIGSQYFGTVDTLWKSKAIDFCDLYTTAVDTESLINITITDLFEANIHLGHQK
jgi:hypothetical protein